MLSLTALAALAGVLGSVSAAQAQLANQLCLKEKTGLNNPACTANDVRIGRLNVISGPTSCMPGEMLNLTVEAVIESGPERYDIGLWLNESGGSAQTDPDGTCFRDFLEPVDDDNVGCNADDGPFFNGEIGEADSCGDVPASGMTTCNTVQVACSEGGGTCGVTRRTFQLTLPCNDSDDDGFADVGTCTSWDNMVDDQCNGVLDTDPGTGSKCNCGATAIGEIFIDPCADSDCSAFDTECTIAVCDPEGEVGNCDGEPINRMAGTACGDGTDTICDNPDTCDGMGNCVDNNEPGTTECRADAGECDVAEFCDGEGNCPADGFEPSGTACGDGTDTICDNPDTCDGSGMCQDNNEPGTTECRPDTGECDVPELCDGNGNCPADGFEPSGTACGDGTDTICDNPDTCDGSGMCQDNNEPSTTECRADAGECDVPELCDGNGNCPADGFEPAGTACGDTSGDVCDNPDTCDGSGMCQDNNEPGETVCRAAVDECDVPETCTGDGSCPADEKAQAGTPCGDGSDTVCDNPDTCDASGMCQDNNEPDTTVCREDMGECDVEERCDGEGNCPADGFEPAGTPCSDDGDICTDDECDSAGMCIHPFNNDPCDDGDACTSGDMCVEGQCVGEPSCDIICRTPGFWGSRSSHEKGGQNVTQAVLDDVGGLMVCGEMITDSDAIGDLDSAIEGLCVRVMGVGQRQLYRQLMAFYLNCALSGFDGNCDALVDIASACNSLCDTGSSLTVSEGECIGALDCFNNGGVEFEGGCAHGTCEGSDELCGGDFGDCPAAEVEGLMFDMHTEACMPFENSCHDQPVCPSEELCFEPLGRASSPQACRQARKSDCTIDDCD